MLVCPKIAEVFLRIRHSSFPSSLSLCWHRAVVRVLWLLAQGLSHPLVVVTRI